MPTDPHNLGTFAAIPDAWKIYPNGGSDGDYITVGGVKLYWNDIVRSWGEETITTGQLNSEVIDHPIIFQDVTQFLGSITVGAFISGASGAFINANGDAEFRDVRVDSLHIKDGESYIPLTTFISNLKAQCTNDWATITKINEVISDLRVILWNADTDTKFYTTMGALQRLFTTNIPNDEATVDLIKVDDLTPEFPDSDNIAFSAARTVLEITTRINNALITLKDEYISKKIDDAAAGLIKFTKGIDIGEYESPGLLGTGGTFRQDPSLGSYLEVDHLTVRKLATFFELAISKLTHVGGQIILSPARAKCISVVYPQDESFYRCYFDTGQEQDGVNEDLSPKWKADPPQTVFNEFVVDDLARCQTFDGTGNVMRYYWRRVIACGHDYIDLSGTDCEALSMKPQAGDEIVQLGHRTDKTRQSAMILSTVGVAAPSFIQYHNINGYTLEGKSFTSFTRNGNEIYGKTKFLSSDGTYQDISDWVEGQDNKPSALNVEFTKGAMVFPTANGVADLTNGNFSFKITHNNRQIYPILESEVGDNLILNSGKPSNTNNWVFDNPSKPITIVGDYFRIDTSGVASTENVWMKQAGSFYLKPETTYTLKFKYKSDNAFYCDIHTNGFTVNYSMGEFLDTNGEYVERVMQFTTDDGAEQPSEIEFNAKGGSLAEVGFIQLVEGEAGTWKRNPQDELSVNVVATNCAISRTGGDVTINSLTANQHQGNVKVTATYKTANVEKQITWAVAESGTNGTNGADAKLLTLSATSDIMSFDANNSPRPANQTVTITAKLQNISGTAVFTAYPYVGNAKLTAITLGGSGNVRTLSSGVWDATWDRVEITATLEGLSDTLSIVKLVDGMGAIVGNLTNGNVTLQATSDGVVSDFSGANGYFKVYDGLMDVSYLTTFGIATGGAVDCTATIGNTAGVKGQIAVTSMSADMASVKFLATYKGVTIEKILTLSKSRAGVNGTSGVGITDVDVQYAVNQSSSTPPIESSPLWKTSADPMSAGDYLWTRTKTTYSNSTISYSTPANITPRAGRSVIAIEEEYAISTSKTVAPSSGWSTSAPTWSFGYYIWTRTKITYSTAPITEYTTAICSSEWEAVNGLSIGTRNLVRNSGNCTNTNFWVSGNPPVQLNSGFLKINTAGYDTSTNIGIVQNTGFTLKKNTDYTLKFTYRSNYGGAVYVRSSDWTSAYSKSLVSTSGADSEITFNFKTGANSNCSELLFQAPGGTTFEVGYIYLVEGNKAGTWMPAPEDVSSQIDYLNNDLNNLLADNVLSRAEKPSERIRWEAELLDYQKLKLQSGAIGGSSLVTDFINSFKSLSTYLNGGVTWVEYNVPSWLGTYLNYDTTIVASSYRSAWTTYFNYKSELLRFYESGVIVGGENLLDSSERIIIGDAQQSSNSQYRSVYDKLKRNTWYVFSVDKITMLAGSSYYATIAIYDTTNNVGLTSTNFTVDASGVQEFAFKTDNIRDYSVLLYAGQSGSTAYKKAQYDKVMLQEGNKRSAWRPNPNEQIANKDYQNLFNNGNFLGGKGLWIAHEGGTFTTSTSDKLVPSGALGLAKRITTSNGGGIHYPASGLALVQGDYYTVSFLLRVDKNSGHTTDNQYISFGYLGDETATRYITVYGEWQRHVFTFQHTTSTPNLFIFSMGYPCDMYITNIMLVKGKEPAPFSNGYLSDALKMSTEINGGLLLSSVIGARDANSQVRTYMNGLAGNTIAFAAGVSNFGQANETREFEVNREGKFKVKNTKEGRAVIIEPETMPTKASMADAAAYETLNGTGQYVSARKTSGTAFSESKTATFTLSQTANAQFTIRAGLERLRAGVNAQANANNVFNANSWWWDQAHWNGGVEFPKGRSVGAMWRKLPAGSWNTISGLTNGSDLQVTLNSLTAGSYEVVVTVSQATPTNDNSETVTFNNVGEEHYGIQYVSENVRKYTKWFPGYIGTTWQATRVGETISETQIASMPYIVYNIVQDYELSISDIRVENKIKQTSMYADGFAVVANSNEYFIVKHGGTNIVDSKGRHTMMSANGQYGLEISDTGVRICKVGVWSVL